MTQNDHVALLRVKKDWKKNYANYKNLRKNNKYEKVVKHNKNKHGNVSKRCWGIKHIKENTNQKNLSIEN